MSLNNPRPGVNYVPEYQASGLPWVLSGSVTTSPVMYELPYVSRAVTVTNNSSAGTFLLIGFTQNGVTLGTNSYPLDGGKSVRLELRVRDLWFKAQSGTATYGVAAELTTIPRQMMPYLTGSAASDLIATGSYVYNGVG
jgi:hypothetical protein